MDSIRVSEALDSGSIPDGTTKIERVSELAGKFADISKGEQLIIALPFYLNLNHKIELSQFHSIFYIVRLAY